MAQFASLPKLCVIWGGRPVTLYHVEEQKQINAARLWERAENAKKGLIAANKPFRTDEKKDGLTDNLKTQHKLGGQQEQELAAAIEIDIKDVNELVRGRVRESVRRCNGLIQERLLAAGGQVDCVCVAGNASRYPLIQETLKQELDEPFRQLPVALLWKRCRDVLTAHAEQEPAAGEWARQIDQNVLGPFLEAGLPFRIQIL